MAVLSTCCCCHSVRKGSFLSAIYTLTYFSIFAIMTGLLVLKDTKLLDDWDFEHPLNETPAMTTQPDSGFTFMGNSSHAHPLVSGTVMADFVCEVAGIFASILLICGLLKEKKSFLIPWLIVLPLHTFIDAWTAIYIILDHSSKSGTTSSQTVFTVLFFFVYLILSALNEYNDGRGTAAYEGLFSQQRNSESAVNYMNPMRDFHSVNSIIRSPNQRRTSQKSDTWMNDDSGLNPTEISPKPSRTLEQQLKPGARKGSAEKNHVVRFGGASNCGETDNSKKSFLKPESYNPRSSLSDKSTHSSSVVEESTAESVGEV